MGMSLQRVRELLRGAGGLICGAVLILFTGLVLYSIVMRYFFSAPPMWGEEIPKLLFIWMIFIGAGFTYLAGANIRMTAVIEMVPDGPRRIIELIMHLMIVAMLIAILWYSIPVIRLTSRFTSLATGLSQAWTFWALPLGACLLLLNEFYRIFRLLKGHVDTPGPVVEVSDR